MSYKFLIICVAAFNVIFAVCGRIGNNPDIIYFPDQLDRRNQPNHPQTSPPSTNKPEIAKPTQRISARCELPYMAILGYVATRNDTEKTLFGCAGTIITESFILTVADCLRTPPKFVRLGRVNLKESEDEKEPVDINIKVYEIIYGSFDILTLTDLKSKYENVIKHPDYELSRKKNLNDIGLIELETKIQFSERIRPACLHSDTNDLPANIDLITSGWGVTTFEDYRMSNVLLKNKVRTLPLQTCNETLAEYARKINALTYVLNSTEYCTELDASCRGDGGNPLVIYNSKISTVVGIVAIGISCGENVPGIYTRVASFLDWIESIAFVPTKNVH